MNRFNQYLLTHYPLLWNTKVVWVLLVNFVLHLLFLLSGLASISTKTIKNYSSIGSVGGEGMFTMAALCALVVVIVWCIYYLRNNAFKSFYRIDKWYLAKEYAIIFLIILTSLSYSVSFMYGVKLKVRSITNEAEMVKEMNALNIADVYIPTNRESYFILNNCEERKKRDFTYNDGLAVTDPTSPYYLQDSARIRLALQRPGAYSYFNFCESFLSDRFYPVDTAEAISEKNRRWLTAQRRDSVKQCIQAFFSILNKYEINYSLNADELATAVFKDTNFSISIVVATTEFNYEHGVQTRNKDFFDSYDVTQVFDFIEDCQPNPSNLAEYKTTWNIIGYLSLSLSILLLCYRRFSKRVFLISVVGTLVWAILVGLMSIGSNSANTFLTILLLLFIVFLLTALSLIKSKASKTFAGVTLNWQAYLSPFVVMLIVGLIDSYHDKHFYNYSMSRDEWMAEHYPFSHWVVNHASEIFLVNIIVVALYMAFTFNHWAKKWQLLPEE